jgi:predicted transcriptional regulator
VGKKWGQSPFSSIGEEIDAMQTLTAKERVTQVVLSLPEDATYDEIIKELALAKMVDRGLDDVRAGRMISNDEMAERIRAWQK